MAFASLPAATLTAVITLGIKFGEPISEEDQRTLDWMRERERAGLPISCCRYLDEDGNEVAPPPVSPVRPGHGLISF